MVLICQEPYKAAKCEEKLHTIKDFEAHLLKYHQKESPDSCDWSYFTRGMGCLHFWCEFCGKYVQSQPRQDWLKERYDHLEDHFLGRAKPSDFEMFKFEPQRVQVRHSDTITTSDDPIEIDTPPHPAPAPHRTTGSTRLNNDKMERMLLVANHAIARLERAQERADRQAASRERAAAQAAAANIFDMAGNGRQHAEDTRMYAGVKYERKTHGPFTGKLVSQGTTININGENYIQYRVLRKRLRP
ncbi:hypothetical protein FANTH_4017 [Fusarium anthophilum]|uniref:Uncharacterized protein n=1 Tax=Fusarium anthophilum TaxID=48485 RepID=A0A8H4ZQ91_9HYPO|nr:hypothetical protein FANTH_4017 [Fusarium anthophilum]